MKILKILKNEKLNWTIDEMLCLIKPNLEDEQRAFDKKPNWEDGESSNLNGTI